MEKNAPAPVQPQQTDTKATKATEAAKASENITELSNADITIAAQKPKLASYIPEMRRMLADVMHVDIDRVSVKATTTERLGFEGREEGISATSVCLLQKV